MRDERPTPTVSPNEKKKKKNILLSIDDRDDLVIDRPHLAQNRCVHAASSYLPYRLDEQTVWDETPLFLDLYAPWEKSPAQKKKRRKETSSTDGFLISYVKATKS